MCEKDTSGELFAVRTALDTLFQTIMRAKHYQYEGEHPLNSAVFDTKFKELIAARDKWLITRNKDDGDIVKDLCKQVAGLSTAGVPKPFEAVTL